MSEKVYDVSGRAAPARLHRRRRQVPRNVRPLDRRSERLLGRPCQAPALVPRSNADQEHDLRSAQCLDQVVRGRHAQRLPNCIDRHLPDARRSGRDHLGRRRRRGRQAHHLPRTARRGVPLGQRAAQPQRREGRPRHDLSADDSRGRLRDAGLRPASARSTRWCSAASRRNCSPAASRTASPRWSSPPTKACAAAARCRSRPTSTRRSTRSGGVGSRARRQAHRRQGRHGAGAATVWYHEAAEVVTSDCPRTEMDAEDPLFILYTSGSTGKPKGVLHTTGGYLRLHVDHPSVRLRLSRRRHLLVHRRCRLGDRPQLHRLWPARQRRDHADVRRRAELSDQSRFWEVIDKHKVNIFYTAPTAIRALMRRATAR